MFRVLTFLVSCGINGAFYLPGVAYKTYKQGDKVDIFVNSLNSAETQLPFDYYYLPFCRPDTLQHQTENLGQVLQGDSFEASLYEVFMQNETSCKTLCTMTTTEKETKNFKWMIDHDYRASWVVDGLPAGYRQTTSYGQNGTKWSYYQDGFPIGFRNGPHIYIYNHLHIVLQVHQLETSPPDEWIVVGVLVDPMSFNPRHDNSPGCSSNSFQTYFNKMKSFQEQVVQSENTNVTVKTEDPSELMHLKNKIMYTYSVAFEPSDVKWASRWDMYLYMGQNNEVHWLSIINSFAMVLFLSGLVAHVLGRSLRRDVTRYNEREDSDLIDETGWKQIHGDVFRPPAYPGFFTMLVGSGVQLLCVVNATLALSCLGFLSPQHRGTLLTAALCGYALMGSVAGFTATKLYITFGGQRWKKNSLSIALFYPGICFSVFFVINLFIWANQSSGAVPFMYLVYLLLMWLGISVPLVLLGSKFGTIDTPFKYPCKTARIPKPLVTIPGMIKIKAINLLAGSLPFACMFIELTFVMKSLWHHTLFYYLFGFLLLCFIVLIITSAEVSVLMTYILLCR